MIAKGTFEVKMQGEPPFELVDGVSLGRATFEKQFTGPLTGTSKVTMLAARTPVDNSAGYVAVERITGTLDGRQGTFVVLQTGLTDRGTRSLSIVIVPDSGTGELKELAGKMDVEIVEGQHHYTLDYTITPR
ncbi:MAG TPA: DUF3224 domain-containing protein [Polyangiaceae bacterium]|nr:DUF3224 domain-containing protein [Polyangiaceae bacterium]